MAESAAAVPERVAGTERVRRIAEALRAGEKPPSATVRDFLSWFGAARRGQWVVSGIRQTLWAAGVETSPDFESAFIDATIDFVLPGSVTPSAAEPPPPEAAIPINASGESPALPGIDPTFRLSRLKAANSPLVYVSPDRSVMEAVTLMLQHDFSQLPVMTNERTVKGMISWRSVASRWALDRPGDMVREFMEDHQEIAADRSLFTALPLIVEHGYVLVRDLERRVTGIVTTADLSLQFQQLAEPFLLIGEIENHIRRLMEGKFPVLELAQARAPGESTRTVGRVADLSFGEYLRFLGQPDRWVRLGLAIDRTVFLQELEKVRLIRNDVMHFDPDPLADADLETLRRVARFLRSLQALGL